MSAKRAKTGNPSRNRASFDPRAIKRDYRATRRLPAIEAMEDRVLLSAATKLVVTYPVDISLASKIPVTATIENAQGVAVTGNSAAISFQITGPGLSSPLTDTQSASSGVAVSKNLMFPSIPAAGSSYTITATDAADGLSGSTTLVAGYTLNTLATFTNSGANIPNGNVVVDGVGDVYGTAFGSDEAGDGAVFEVANGAGVVSQVAPTLNVGNTPLAGLGEDSSNGNLFGATTVGGLDGDGSIFELQNTSGNTNALSYSSSVTQVAGITSGTVASGAAPIAVGGSVYYTTPRNLFIQPENGGTATVIPLNVYQSAGVTTTDTNIDTGTVSGVANQQSAGLATNNFFIATQFGGVNNLGAILEYNASSQTLSLVFSFTNATGDMVGTAPQASLYSDSSGDLFGTTTAGGLSGQGSVFEMKADSSAPLGVDAPTALASFPASTLPLSPSSVVVDGDGNVFGATAVGGANGDGEIFEVAPNSTDATPPAPITLVSFDGVDGNGPTGVTLHGTALYGTTAGTNGSSGSPTGTVFELVPSAVTPHLAFYSQLPTAVAAGQTIGAVQVAIEDQNGDVITQDNASITIARNSGPAQDTVTGTTTQTAAMGIATFTDLSIHTLTGGQYTLGASDANDPIFGTNGVAPAISTDFTASAASSLSIVTQPGPTGSVAAGSPIDFVVDVDNIQGQPVATDSSTIALTITSGPSSQSGNQISGSTATVVNGVAKFLDLTLDTPGVYTLTAADTGAGDSAVPAVTSQSFTVTQAGTTPQTLTAKLGALKLPSTPIAENFKFQGSTSVTVTNALSTAQKGKIIIQIAAAPDGVLDGNSEIIGSLTHAVNLAAANSAKSSVTLKVRLSVVPNFSGANVPLIVVTTDVSGTENIPATASGVTLPFVEPAISELVVPPTISFGSSLSPSGSAEATFYVTNTAATAFSGSAAFTFGESNNDSSESAMISSAGGPIKLHLAPGKSKLLHIKFTVTSGIAVSQKEYPVVSIAVTPKTGTAYSDVNIGGATFSVL